MASAGKSAQRRLAHGRAVHIFAGIHKGENGAEDPCFQLVGHRVTAGSDAYKKLAARRNLLHKLDLPFMARNAEGRFAAHFRAFLLNREGEMQDAHVLAQ